MLIHNNILSIEVKCLAVELTVNTM